MAKKIILEKEELDKLINLYKSGTSLREMVTITGYSRGFLSKTLKANNVSIRDNTLNSRKYNHIENYFEDIDTEEKAYWLGFMYADGYITNNSFGFSINSIDINHAVKFNKSLQANNPIREYKGTGYSKDSIVCRTLLTSAKTVNDLIAKGCIRNKTLQLKFPTEDIVPKHLIHHFIRGYMDGDGSINYHNRGNYQAWQVGFIGQEDFLNKIKEFFNKSELKLSTKDNITYQINFTGNKQVKHILNILYRDATIYLDRKYDKYKEFMNSKYGESQGING